MDAPLLIGVQLPPRALAGARRVRLARTFAVELAAVTAPVAVGVTRPVRELAREVKPSPAR